MSGQILIKGKKINYIDEGTGNPIVFLHGYLESAEVWTSFTDKLKDKYRIIRIDLPGFGKSECFDSSHSMSMMADVVKKVLEYLEIKKAYFVGHSLGGYVLLTFLDKYPRAVRRFCLFHSHPFPDTEESRENRNKQIEMVKAGNKQLLIRENIEKMFAEKNIAAMAEKVDQLTSLAEQTSDNGIVAALEGMKSRKDASKILAMAGVPFLYVLGKNDKFISIEMFAEIQFPVFSRTLLLENSGHIGFIEEPEKCLVSFNKFFK